MNYDIANMDKSELVDLINSNKENIDRKLLDAALSVREKHFDRSVYLRGLIEFSNYCVNNCYYCGIRHANKNINRYRLNKKEILECCENGYALGFRTFVLQSGDDPYYTDDIMCSIISAIKTSYPDCAVTLSLGEKSEGTYRKFWNEGADRYLLRHETANETHYNTLHPNKLSLKKRKECLYILKEIGFQVGAGFMVGSPYQTIENLAEDLLFLKDLKPHMVGVGPFIPHKDTQFSNHAQGTLDLTLTMVALTRLMLPKALLPSTTALGTIDPNGREKGFMAGANVVMPNLSPIENRKDYLLYDNKICTGEEAAESLLRLQNKVENAGFYLDFSRGDYKN